MSAPLSALGRLYRNSGRYAEAEPLLLRAVAICERAQGPEHPELVDTLNVAPELVSVLENYTALLDQLGRGNEASELRAKAAAIRQQREQVPPSSP